MKIIYIAFNPLKGFRRFTKSVTATLYHKSSTIKYKHIRFSCILMNQMYQWERNSNTKMGLEKAGLKVLFKLTFTLGFSVQWYQMVRNSKYMGHSAWMPFQCIFYLALGGIFNRFWEPDLNRRLGKYCSKRSLKYDGAFLFIHLKHKTQIL